MYILLEALGGLTWLLIGFLAAMAFGSFAREGAGIHRDPSPRPKPQPLRALGARPSRGAGDSGGEAAAQPEPGRLPRKLRLEFSWDSRSLFPPLWRVSLSLSTDQRGTQHRSPQ